MLNPGTEEYIGFVKKKLFSRWDTNANVLRKENPGIAHLLTGEFLPGECNVYEGGGVVSMRLFQDELPHPTVGIIMPGRYKFNTGDNMETMIVLDGGPLFAGLNMAPESHLQIYASVIAPAGQSLRLRVQRPTFYLCMYRPKDKTKKQAM